MYYEEDYRICPECGKTKHVPREFWWDARRCRKCVGRERSEQARKRREAEAQ